MCLDYPWGGLPLLDVTEVSGGIWAGRTNIRSSRSREQPETWLQCSEEKTMRLDSNKYSNKLV